MLDSLQVQAASPLVHQVALLLLCVAYLQGGIDKARDFPGAVAEVRRLGLAPAAPIAAAVIVLQLGGSALVISGWYRWAGAAALAAFTVLAALLANRFWQAVGAERRPLTNAFFEHLGLAGGLLLAAWIDVGGARG